MGVLTLAYIERGYVTSGAVIPDQTIEDGVILIEVIEGAQPYSRIDPRPRGGEECDEAGGSVRRIAQDVCRPSILADRSSEDGGTLSKNPGVRLVTSTILESTPPVIR